MPDGEAVPEEEPQTDRPEKLRMRTQAEIEDINDVWDIDDLDSGEELRDAIEKVRNDHSAEVVVEEPPLWYLVVHWNDNTDRIWAAAHGYNGGFEVTEA